MADITNRSPWEVKPTKSPPVKFRLKSEAVSHLVSLGHDLKKLPHKVMMALTRFHGQLWDSLIEPVRLQ